MRSGGVVMVTLVAMAGADAARPALAASQTVDTVGASAAVNAFRANCRAVGEALWGASLCGPQVLVHAPTRAALASQPDPDGAFLPVIELYAGRLPDGLPVANTAMEWGADRWSMVLLPLPEDRRASYALLAHEAFHRAQPQLGFELTDPASPHLDEREGRVWLRLELRALARALETTGEVAIHAALDGLRFRAYRHRLYPGSDSLESELERNEGLAEYTGHRYASMLLGDDPGWTALGIRDFESRDSYVRSFAYATGPGLGLLLDRYHPGWRRAVHQRGLADLLAEALSGAPITEIDGAAVLARAQEYGHAAVDAEEAERAARLAARLAEIRSRLIDGPTLLLRQSNLGATFDPNAMVPIPGAGTYYPTGSFTAAWGRLEVHEGGALVSPDWTTLRLPAADLRIEADGIHGHGWMLQLADGWSPREVGDGWELVGPED